jgi:hypothetical protein
VILQGLGQVRQLASTRAPRFVFVTAIARHPSWNDLLRLARLIGQLQQLRGIARVNAPLTAEEQRRVQVSIERGRPYGDDRWVTQTVKALKLEQTVRREGRPRGVEQSSPDAVQ